MMGGGLQWVVGQILRSWTLLIPLVELVDEGYGEWYDTCDGDCFLIARL